MWIHVSSSLRNGADKRIIPAALLAEPLLQSMGDDDGGLGVELAHLVSAVVVLRAGEIGFAPLGLAPRRLVAQRVHASRPREQVVHLEAVPGRKVGPLAQI